MYICTRVTYLYILNGESVGSRQMCVREGGREEGGREREREVMKDREGRE